MILYGGRFRLPCRLSFSCPSAWQHPEPYTRRDNFALLFLINRWLSWLPADVERVALDHPRRRADGFALARPSGCVRLVEQHVLSVQPMEPQGVWRRLFAAMSDDPDFEYLIVDSTIIRGHQHASGVKWG